HADVRGRDERATAARRCGRGGSRRRRNRGRLGGVRLLKLVLLQVDLVEIRVIDTATHQEVDDRTGAPEETVPEADDDQEDKVEPDRRQDAGELVQPG